MTNCMFRYDFEKPIVAQLVKIFPTSHRIQYVRYRAHTSSPLDPVTTLTYFTSLACTLIFLLHFTLRQPTNCNILRYRMDLEKQHAEYELFFPAVEMHCNYNVSGQVLLLPITGRGDGVLVFSEYHTVGDSAGCCSIQ